MIPGQRAAGRILEMYRVFDACCVSLRQAHLFRQ